MLQTEMESPAPTASLASPTWRWRSVADDIKDALGEALGDFDNDGHMDVVMNTNPGDCLQRGHARPSICSQATRWS